MNNDIALFKFAYAWFIVFFHFFPGTAFVGGYVGVEFYLLVAGVFFFQSYEKQKAADKMVTPGEYGKRRFARLFPWAFTAFLFTAAIKRGSALLHGMPVKALVNYFVDDIWEILLIKWNGMNDNALLLNGPAWTMSSMLIVGFALWAVLYFFDKPFLHFFMPVSLLIGYGFWRHIPEANTELWIGFTAFGTFRTYLVMCLGYYCLQLSKKLAAIPWNRWGLAVLTVVECLCHAATMWIMLTKETRNFQWTATLMLIVAIAIALSGKSYLYRLLQRWNPIHWLQDLSLSVYLMHIGVIIVFEHFFGEVYEGPYLLILIGAILVGAVCHLVITRYLIRVVPRLWRRFMSLLHA